MYQCKNYESVIQSGVTMDHFEMNYVKVFFVNQSFCFYDNC